MRRTVIFIAACLAIVPLATASWSYRGESEPDTIYDEPRYMWFDPDQRDDGRRVYFSGFLKAGSNGDFNANVGLVGSRVLPPQTSASMVLGFWKDCNEDGYVGQAEGALLEYRSELLVSDELCPPVNPNGQQVYPHNDGSWVRELIWIGPTKVGGAAGTHTDNPTNFYDNGVLAWGDYGLPGGIPPALCPGGNVGLRSTGAILDYADCATYFRGVRALNSVQDASGGAAPTGGWDTSDVDNSPSPLNIDNPAYYYLYGPEEGADDPNEGDYRGYSGGFLGRDSDSTSRQRAVTIVDCDAGPAGPDTSPEPAIPSNPTDSSTYPSVYESLNDTYVVMVQGDDDCAPNSDGDEGLPYNTVHPEGYSENTFPDAGRQEVDHRFKFYPGNRNFPAAPLTGDCRTQTGTPTMSPGALGYCPPADLGTAVIRHDGPIGGAWRANVLTNMYPIYARESMRTDNPDFGGWYSTFYVRLGDATLNIAGAVPAGNEPSIYGAEACTEIQPLDGVIDNVVENYWHCDPDQWAFRCIDQETQVQPEDCHKVGYTYHLRDVDCWDNTLVRGTPARASIASVSPSGACQDHPSNAGPLS